MILALIGPHGVGKTSLGERLAARLHLPFDEELGRALAADPAWRPAGATAADAAARFDEELFGRELSRDLRRGAQPRVVETWHLGNLAYAARRSPEVVAAWRAQLRTHCGGQPALILPLLAPREVLARRQNEAGDLSFFIEVGEDARRWADALGLPCLPPVDTSQAPPEQLAADLATKLNFLVQPQHRSLR